MTIVWKDNGGHLGTNRGFTLIEVMLAVALLSLVFLLSFRSFYPMIVGFTTTNQRAIIEQILQNRIEEIRGGGYALLSVSTAPQAVPNLPTTVLSDSGFYPPTIFTENGTDYVSHVVVHYMVPDSHGDLQPTNPFGPDTGRKRITITVAWKSGGYWRTQTATGLLESKGLGTKNVLFQGTVTHGGGIPLLGAKIQTLEDAGAFGQSDIAGDFQFNVRPGTYTLVATCPGYFSVLKNNCFVSYQNSPSVQPFHLTARDVGTVQGSVWINDHLVISRVVGESGGGEWVEVFNPTTWTWIGADIGLSVQSIAQPDPVPILFNTPPMSDILPGRFFLLANNAAILGVTSDAVWSGDQIPFNQTAGVSLYVVGGSTQDSVGWGTVGSPPLVEGVKINTPLAAGAELFRFSNVSGPSTLVGPAYDSGNNQVDFTVAVAVPPRNSLSTQPIAAGTPAEGAVVMIDDGMSTPVTAALVGTPPEAQYVMPNVATGTWSVVGGSRTFMSVVPCTVPSAGVVTTPLFLTTAAVVGYVSGRVMDAVTNLPLPNIEVSPGGMTNADGTYMVSLPSGNGVLTANPGGTPPYGTASQGVTVTVGALIRGEDFLLPRSAILVGRVKWVGSVGVSGVPITFRGLTQASFFETTTDKDGNYSITVPTGTYLVTPSLPYTDPMSIYYTGVSGKMTNDCTASSPGAVVNCGTITNPLFPVSITGTVTRGGAPVENGAIVELWGSVGNLKTITDGQGKYVFHTFGLTTFSGMDFLVKAIGSFPTDPTNSFWVNSNTQTPIVLSTSTPVGIVDLNLP